MSMNSLAHVILAGIITEVSLPDAINRVQPRSYVFIYEFSLTPYLLAELISKNIEIFCQGECWE